MIEVVLDDITPDEEKANHDQDDKKRGKRDEPGARVFSKPRLFFGTLCTSSQFIQRRRQILGAFLCFKRSYKIGPSQTFRAMCDIPALMGRFCAVHLEKCLHALGLT